MIKFYSLDIGGGGHFVNPLGSECTKGPGAKKPSFRIKEQNDGNSNTIETAASGLNVNDDIHICIWTPVTV